MAQTQSQKQRGQQGTSLNTATQQGDEADQGRQQGGRGELPKQQNQDPSRRSGPRDDQQDDPKNNQTTVSHVSRWLTKDCDAGKKSPSSSFSSLAPG